jgi:hypothetical protein
MSALGTQVTYEGLLDEVFGIDEGYVEVGPDIGCADGPVIRVLPADTLYAQVRDLNLSAVPTTFNAHTRLLGQARDDLQSSDSMFIFSVCALGLWAWIRLVLILEFRVCLNSR